jgi:adenylate cyclase
MEKSPGQAVLFADVSGSTRLYDTLGNTQALSCIGMCLDIIRDAAQSQGGRVVKAIGDELMCVFPDPGSAARAATEMQNRINMQDPISGQQLAIRVGMDFGPVILKEGDVFGDCVNVAARMAALAKAGQIITTGGFVEKLPAEMRSMTRSLDSLAVKGKVEEVAVYELMPVSSEDMTTLATRYAAKVQVTLRLRHGERELVPGPDVKAVKLGRDPSSDIMIDDRKASREHARIERRRDKYVLIDRSSNGTFVTFQGQAELVVRREEVILYGRGSLSFGHAYADDPAEVVTFQIE